MSEVEDIIARAICNRQKPKPERGDAYDNLRGWAFVDSSADAELRGFDQDSAAAIAALDAAGYVIVPKKPTEAMQQAFEDQFAVEFAYTPTSPWDRADRLFAAMIEAAKP